MLNSWGENLLDQESGSKWCFLDTLLYPNHIAGGCIDLIGDRAVAAQGQTAMQQLELALKHSVMAFIVRCR
jgi:hypothetical protein